MDDTSARHDADTPAVAGAVRRYLLPIAVLVLVVAVVSALVLTGVVEGDKERPEAPPASTTPTIEILP